MGLRTWLLTITHKVRSSPEDFDREVVQALKRLRHCGRFRYLLVFERHKPQKNETVGYPHAHALVHERDRLLWEDFDAVFSRVGFFRATRLKGDPGRAAAYVTKYMSKASFVETAEGVEVWKDPVFCRVRASLGYGGPANRPVAAGAAAPAQSTCDNSPELKNRTGEFATAHDAPVLQDVSSKKVVGDP